MAIDKDELRERITQEDALLGTRTTSFLLGNGFLMAALGISEVSFEKAIIAALGVAIALIWLLVCWQSKRAITVLHQLYHQHFPDDPINKAVFSKLMWEKKFLGNLFGPTALIASWLPFIILTTWVSININMHVMAT